MFYFSRPGNSGCQPGAEALLFVHCFNYSTHCDLLICMDFFDTAKAFLGIVPKQFRILPEVFKIVVAVAKILKKVFVQLKNNDGRCGRNWF